MWCEGEHGRAVGLVGLPLIALLAGGAVVLIIGRGAERADLASKLRP